MKKSQFTQKVSSLKDLSKSDVYSRLKAEDVETQTKEQAKSVLLKVPTLREALNLALEKQKQLREGEIKSKNNSEGDFPWTFRKNLENFLRNEMTEDDICEEYDEEIVLSVEYEDDEQGREWTKTYNRFLFKPFSYMSSYNKRYFIEFENGEIWIAEVLLFEDYKDRKNLTNGH
jgi:hypothetical protein